jgi:Lysine-specific metallo-endopeptidase
MPSLKVGNVRLNNFSTLSRLTQVKDAYVKVSTLLSKGINALKDDFSANDKTEEDRFKLWFGSAANRVYVLDRLKPMRLQLSLKGFVVIEDLTDPDTIAFVSSIAFTEGVANDTIYGSEGANFTDAAVPMLLPSATYPSSLNQMTICKAFYTAPQLGTNDSQVGTILHELSHLVSHTEDVEDETSGYFTAPYVAGDHVFYGEEACKWLAKNRPLHARHNADNYLMYLSSFK